MCVEARSDAQGYAASYFPAEWRELANQPFRRCIGLEAQNPTKRGHQCVQPNFESVNLHDKEINSQLGFDAPLGSSSLDVMNDYDLPVYQQYWWLNCVRGTNCHEATVQRGGLTVGRLSFSVKRVRMGFLWGENHPWSHVGGPILSRNLTRGMQSEVLDELLAQLPGNTSYRFVSSSQLSYSDLVKSAFVKVGFTYTKEVNYVRRPGTLDVMSELKSKHRTHIKAAAREMEIVELSAEEFVNFYQSNLEALGRTSRAPLAIVKHLITVGAERRQIRVIAARRRRLQKDLTFTSHVPYDAAIACARDKGRYYYWMSTRRRHLCCSQQKPPHPDAIKLLVMNAMHHAQSLGLIFDADGVTSPGSDHLYKQIFGLKEEEARDVFTRSALLPRLCEKYRPAYRKIVALFKRVQLHIPFSS